MISYSIIAVISFVVGFVVGLVIQVWMDSHED